MANSTLFRTGEQDPVVTRGHGTGALGPSDSTDTGSDIAGGPGLNDEDGLGLDQGTTSDPDHDGPGANAGADLGDANLDSDTDRYGTGERGAAGRDGTVPNDEVLREDGVDAIREDENPHDFSRRATRGRQTLDAMDEPVDDQIGSGGDALDDEEEAPGGGEQHGLISGGIGGPSGTGDLGGAPGPGSGRNPGRR
jgi:hypothetical protein